MGFLRKKAQQGGLVAVFASVIGIGLVLLILGIFQAYQADIVTDVQADFVNGTGANNCNTINTTTCGYAFNVTQENLEATESLAERQSTLTNIAVAVIIISMLLFAAAAFGIRFAAR